MKGINVKQTKDGDEFIIKFEVVEDTFEKAVDAAETVKHKLKNMLEGQTTLENEYVQTH